MPPRPGKVNRHVAPAARNLRATPAAAGKALSAQHIRRPQLTGHEREAYPQR